MQSTSRKGTYALVIALAVFEELDVGDPQEVLEVLPDKSLVSRASAFGAQAYFGCEGPSQVVDVERAPSDTCR